MLSMFTKTTILPKHNLKNVNHAFRCQDQDVVGKTN